jgi:hypothetical protein
MVAELPANLALSCQFTPAELTELAARLRARADALAPPGHPEDQRDLSIAALVVEEVVQLHTDMRESRALINRIRRTLGLAEA